MAAVFVNRLRQGMRLQSDPTIIYGIVGGKGRLDRPITKKDIAEKTPYNTYRINGLPPGPISNPGRAAIEAVLNPPDTKELYFVADGTGGHAFAETLDQHRANVENWRKIEKARKEDAEAEAIADAKAEPDDATADAAAAAEEAGPAAASPAARVADTGADAAILCRECAAGGARAGALASSRRRLRMPRQPVPFRRRSRCLILPRS